MIIKAVVDKNRIGRLLEKKRSNLLSVYYTAGFPNKEDTGTIAIALAKSGADIIEIGVPFSDPVADGPVIQASSKVALENGMSLTILLDQVQELRSQVELPIILMGYFNPILQFGVEKFCQRASEAGVDGVIIPDLPIAEYHQHYHDLFVGNGLENIFLISPTTSEARIRQIDDLSNSFIYAVSASSTTGARERFEDEQISYFNKLKQMELRNPFLIGFGISNRATFSEASKFAAGAIVGSAFVSMLSNSKSYETDIVNFVNELTGL